MKKNSKLEILPDNDTSWSSSLENHPFILWATDNGKTLLYSLLALILATTLGYRLFSTSQVDSQDQFRSAENNYAQLSANSSENPQNAFNQLNQTIGKYPELHAKYDGLLAQLLLIQGDVSKAIPFANAAINRTAEENDPFYTAYAKNSLLIADQKYAIVLKNSLEMQENMQIQGKELEDTPEKLSFGTLIYALNLFRIGMLQQELGLKTEELNTWNEWKILSGQSRESKLPNYLDSSQFIALENLLSEGQTSFSSYIEAREKVLKQKV